MAGRRDPDGRGGQPQRATAPLAVLFLLLAIGAPQRAASDDARRPERDELELGGLDLFLESRASGNPLAFHLQPGAGAGWQERLSVRGELDRAVPWKLEFKTDMVDRLRLAGEDLDAGHLGDLGDWKRLTVGETRVKVGLLGDRLRGTTRFGWSRTQEAPDDPVTLALLGAEPVDSGFALLQRLDAVLWKSDRLKLEGFGLYGRVGSGFETLSSSRKNRKDFFAGPNRQAMRGGGKLSVGPLALTLSQSALTYGIGGDEGERRHQGSSEAEVELHLDELSYLLGRSGEASAWKLAPNSFTVNVARGAAEPYAGAERTDGVQDSGFGVWWYRDSWGMGMSVWRSLWDSRQPGSEEADWTGSGAELSYEYYGERWDLWATAGGGRYRNEERWSRSAELELQGSIGATLRPRGLPDLAAGLSLNRHATDYIAWRTASRARYWEATAALDFSKFLPARGERKPSLKLVYNLANAAEDAGFEGTGSSALEHAVLVTVDLAY